MPGNRTDITVVASQSRPALAAPVTPAWVRRRIDEGLSAHPRAARQIGPDLRTTLASIETMASEAASQTNRLGRDRRDPIVDAIGTVVEAAAWTAVRLASSRAGQTPQVLPATRALLELIANPGLTVAPMLTDGRVLAVLEHAITLRSGRKASRTDRTLSTHLETLTRHPEARQLDLVPELIASAFEHAGHHPAWPDEALPIVARWLEQALTAMVKADPDLTRTDAMRRTTDTVRAVIASPGWMMLGAGSNDRSVAQAVDAITRVLRNRTSGRVPDAIADRLFTLAIEATGRHPGFLAPVPGEPNGIGGALEAILQPLLPANLTGAVWTLMHRDTLPSLVEQCLGALAGTRLDAEDIAVARTVCADLVEQARVGAPIDLSTIGELLVDTLP